MIKIDLNPHESVHNIFFGKQHPREKVKFEEELTATLIRNHKATLIQAKKNQFACYNYVRAQQKVLSH